MHTHLCGLRVHCCGLDACINQYHYMLALQFNADLARRLSGHCKWLVMALHGRQIRAKSMSTASSNRRVHIVHIHILPSISFCPSQLWFDCPVKKGLSRPRSQPQSVERTWSMDCLCTQASLIAVATRLVRIKQADSDVVKLHHGRHSILNSLLNGFHVFS